MTSNFEPQESADLKSCFVVPCYNEATRLDVKTILKFIASSSPHLSLLFVNDGSTDQTQEVLESISDVSDGRASVLKLEQNQGKPEAVRHGLLRVLENSPDIIGYWDADLATPLSTIPIFVDFLNQNPHIEVLLGARVKLLGREIKRSRFRHYPGRIIGTLISLSLGIPSYDTQCGAKAIRVNDATEEHLKKPFQTDWLFDVELLGRYLAHYRKLNPSEEKGKFFEYPLSRWEDIEGSKVKPIDGFFAIIQLAKLYWNELRFLRLPDSP